MSGKFASETTVSPERTRAEIEGILRRYKADQYAYAWSNTEAAVAFCVAGRPVKFTVPLPDRKGKQFTHTLRRGHTVLRSPQQQDDAYDQAVRQRWRALLLLIKAQLEAVELGLISFETAFLPWLVMTNGQTVGQAMIPQLPERGAVGGEVLKLMG